MYGLNEADVKTIKNTIRQFDSIENAVIFGSRAMGNYKNGSDVDIALKGKLISNQTIIILNDLLNEECPLPYFFDILHYDNINNPELKTHIDQYGVLIV